MPRSRKQSPDSDLTMQVVNHIGAMIEKGKLKPGDRIPAEREFARSLRVSRASLRTGLGYMAAMGILKVRRGVGTFVADGPPQIGHSSLNLISALHGFQSWQLFEARLTLESTLAALAAERGKKEHHLALAYEVVEMFAAIDDPTEYLIHDVLFHRIISQASGNPILAVLMETVTSALYETRRKTVERSGNLRESAEMHREISRAIRAQDADEARRLMERHLRVAEEAENAERPTGAGRTS
jgi:GntR family transcriptional regulator, transcriptional repressor for pyruvate dehydrogenase complex